MPGLSLETICRVHLKVVKVGIKRRIVHLSPGPPGQPISLKVVKIVDLPTKNLKLQALS